MPPPDVSVSAGHARAGARGQPAHATWRASAPNRASPSSPRRALPGPRARRHLPPAPRAARASALRRRPPCAIARHPAHRYPPPRSPATAAASHGLR